jgi:4-hydroxybenzoate polyprenyltransferase
MMRTVKPAAAEESKVIAVDLDGSLLQTDCLHEGMLIAIRQRPLSFLRALFCLPRGKAAFKSAIASLVDIDCESLPYNQDLLSWLEHEKKTGSKIVLCTAADQRYANAIAEHLKLFDVVLASNGSINLSGANKRTKLDALFGSHQYTYVGNSPQDIEVWKGARHAVVVGNVPGLAAAAAEHTEVSATFRSRSISYADWLKALRVHQYVKNLLLFVPLLAAHRITDLDAMVELMVAFVSFGLCASTVYIINDLMDLGSDRRHPTKRLRSFASGALPISHGIAMIPLTAASSLGLAVIVGPSFALWLSAYFLLTFCYSLKLKELALVDCLTLAALYTLRIVAGAATAQVALSFWLVAFSGFIFLSLAFVKRFAELSNKSQSDNKKLHGRGYVTSDLPIVQSLGVASAYAAVVVLALYLNDHALTRLYPNPHVLWAAIPVLLFWISRIWIKAHRGQMNEDPVLYSIRDRVSIFTLALLGLTFLAGSVELSR